MNQPRKLGRANRWLNLFLVSCGAVIALKLTGAINSTTGLVLMAGSMGLLVPMVRAMGEKGSGCNPANPAALRYARRMAAATALYVLGLGSAIMLDRAFELAGAAGFVIALLPVLPIFAMIWAMARYLLEEQDEYLRHRATVASLAGLALVLGLGSFWGFLETFRLAPHVPGWWAVPVWAIGMGLSQAWLSARDRAEGEE